jgi:hypothetical protein
MHGAPEGVELLLHVGDLLRHGRALAHEQLGPLHELPVLLVQRAELVGRALGLLRWAPVAVSA